MEISAPLYSTIEVLVSEKFFAGDGALLSSNTSISVEVRSGLVSFSNACMLVFWIITNWCDLTFCLGGGGGQDDDLVREFVSVIFCTKGDLYWLRCRWPLVVSSEAVLSVFWVLLPTLTIVHRSLGAVYFSFFGNRPHLPFDSSTKHLAGLHCLQDTSNSLKSKGNWPSARVPQVLSASHGPVCRLPFSPQATLTENMERRLNWLATPRGSDNCPGCPEYGDRM